jgi:hypothetical protein
MRFYVFSAAVFLFLTASVSSAAAPELEGCRTVYEKTGKQADAEIYRLHGRKIGFESSYIAEYACGDTSAVLWVSFSETKNKAEDLFREMDEKMPSSKTFTGYRKFRQNGETVSYVSGMGMDNYYFLRKKGNYWLAAQGKGSADVLEKLIQTLK